MGNRIKLPNIDFAKAGDDIGWLAKDVAKFVGNHREKFLGGGLLLVASDGIREALIILIVTWENFCNLTIDFCFNRLSVIC